MDSCRCDQLNELVDLTRQMLESARAMDWDGVARLEDRRRRRVRQCFSYPTSSQDAPEVAESIREILRLNEAITKLGRDFRDQLGGEIRIHKTGRLASAAYLGCSR